MKVLIFNSNRDDIDRRHLWSIGVTGGKAIRLTQGNGIEWRPVMPANGQDLVFLCSTAFQPAAPALVHLKGGKHRLIAPEVIPNDFPMNKLVEPQQVIFKAADSFEIHGQLFLPKGTKPGNKRPAVIFMHGGPIRQMLLGWHMRGYYHNSYALNQYLASEGYVVLSVNFRSGIGYGRAFRSAPDQGPRGASEYQDIVAAGRYLQKRPEVDPERIGLWGGSYGGYLTALGLARDSELFAAGVDLHGVHDWALRGRRRDGGGWGLHGEDLMKLAYESSPVADIRFYANVLSLVVQFFLVSLIMRKLGLVVALLVLPLAIVGSSAAFFAVSTLYVGSLLHVSDNGLNYSIQQTSRESLYVVTTPDEKYKARAFTNMFVQRLGKGLSILAVMGLIALDVGVKYLSLLTISVAIGMILCSIYAGRHFAQKSSSV